MTTGKQSDSRRDDIIARIQKLRKMTTAAGCSEAEAQSAARMVQALIDEYSVGETELSLKADAFGCVLDHWIEFKSSLDDWSRLTSVQVARLYNCKVKLESGMECPFPDMPLRVPFIKVQFFGYPQDVEACLATAELICTAVNGEATRWKPADGRRTPNKLRDFRLGMIDRFNSMLMEMRRQRTAPATGTSLVVLKDQLVTQEWIKRGFEETISRRGREQPRNAAAYAAGQQAAGNHSLRRDAGVGHRQASQPVSGLLK